MPRAVKSSLDSAEASKTVREPPPTLSSTLSEDSEEQIPRFAEFKHFPFIPLCDQRIHISE